MLTPKHFFVVPTTIVIQIVLVNAGYGQTPSTVFPTKPIRVVTAEAGGTPDLAARLIAAGLSTRLGQQVLVENRASGVIPGDTVAKAAPDGYTLHLASNTLWILPLMQNTPYDPVRDFAPIALTNISPNIVTVHPSLPVKSVKELVALAKTRPGELNYASSSAGAASHLAGELFKSMAGVNIVRVAYRGSGIAINDMISGQVQVAFYTPTTVMPNVRAGKLRALAVTSGRPFTLIPELPTVSAAGIPGYESGAIYALLAPAKTPDNIINRLNQETAQALNSAMVKEKLAAVGSEAVASSPAELAATIKSEMGRMGKVIKDAGIRAD